MSLFTQHAGAEMAFLHPSIYSIWKQSQYRTYLYMQDIRVCCKNILHSYTDIRVWGAYLNLSSYPNLSLATTTSWLTKKTEIVNIAFKLKCLLNKDTCWTVHMCQIEISVKLGYQSELDTFQIEVFVKMGLPQTGVSLKLKTLVNSIFCQTIIQYLSNWDICKTEIPVKLR